jgi:ABC-type Fe3+/spermidine/putrescine transport system ATPase subunit
VTHDQIEAMVLADRIAVMAHGEILQVGNPLELYRRPANALVAEFFGSINWLGGQMLEANCVETELGRLSVGDACQSGAVVVGIRPEDVRLERAFNGGENRIEGKVTRSTFLGDQVVTEVKLREKTVMAKSMPDAGLFADQVTVYLPKERLVVFPERAARSVD